MATYDLNSKIDGIRLYDLLQKIQDHFIGYFTKHDVVNYLKGELKIKTGFLEQRSFYDDLVTAGYLTLRKKGKKTGRRYEYRLNEDVFSQRPEKDAQTGQGDNALEYSGSIINQTSKRDISRLVQTYLLLDGDSARIEKAIKEDSQTFEKIGQVYEQMSGMTEGYLEWLLKKDERKETDAECC